ncbi:transposase [Micromonospora sp. NPDC023966]|uniref:IS110 family transposase n=1 Tax=Micromonospora sp. NPDC023966 TaxID=3154699 RepID=UPI0033D456E1
MVEAGFTVFVIAPNQIKNLRGGYGPAGNRDDRFDAFVLADTVRTDQARLHPLTPDTAAPRLLPRTGIGPSSGPQPRARAPAVDCQPPGSRATPAAYAPPTAGGDVGSNPLPHQPG